MRIGRLEIERGALLAPLCGITTSPYRKICRRLGASLVFSETISSDGLFQMSRRTIDLARFDPEERPIGVQIFGADPERMTVAARIVEDLVRPDLIDLNFGCPVPKFVRHDRGAALLKDPPRIGRIVGEVVRAVRTPVSAKIRAGWDEASIRVAEIARVVEGEGGALLTVHGRTRSQAYRGEANWEWVAEAVRAVSIPVVGNGDVDDAETAERRIAESGCAAVMIGRASIGNPWVFREVRHRLLRGVDAPPPSPEERLRMIREHLALHIEDRGLFVGIREFRRHLSCYVRGLPGSAAFRSWANAVESREELEGGLGRFFDGLSPEAAHGP
ncbi:MAG: tRNA dihydrouridine synthase DusB [Candidatus Eisenbacteria bacterium]